MIYKIEPKLKKEVDHQINDVVLSPNRDMNQDSSNILNLNELENENYINIKYMNITFLSMFKRCMR